MMFFYRKDVQLFFETITRKKSYIIDHTSYIIDGNYCC